MFDWYEGNFFKVDADKCHLFLSPFSVKEINIAICNIASNNSEELMRIVTDNGVVL